MNVIKKIKYKTLTVNVFQDKKSGQYFTDVDGDYWDTIAEAELDGIDTMKSKYEGTYYPSAQEIHNERMERLYC